MNEYLETLKIRAESGSPEAVKAYRNAIAHQYSIWKSTRRLASELRGDGTDVNYRPDGGIEFNLGEKPMSQATENSSTAYPKEYDPGTKLTDEQIKASEETYYVQLEEYNPHKFLFQRGKGKGGFVPLTFEEGSGAGLELAKMTAEQAQKWVDKNMERAQLINVPDSKKGDNTELKTNSKEGLLTRLKKAFNQNDGDQPYAPSDSDSQSSDGGGALAKPPKKKGKRGFSTLTFVILVCLGFLLFATASLNVQPFIALVAAISQIGTFGQFMTWLSNLWIIGWFVSGAGAFGVVVAGTLLYLCCQIVEVAVVLFRRDPRRTGKIIDKAANWKKYGHKDGDSRIETQLKNSYNDTPITGVRWLYRFGIIVYLFELFVTIWYKPWSQPITNFLYFLATAQWSKIDFGAIALTASVMFLAQIIVSGLLIFFPDLFPVVKEEGKKS